MYVPYLYNISRETATLQNDKRKTKKSVKKKRHFRVKIRKKYCRFFYAIDIHFRRTNWLATNSDYCIKKIINYFWFLR